jgi:hypothetical protein
VKLKSLRLLEKNARYMAEPEFGRLVANLKRDGVLTSLPLTYRGKVLSGNHRVQAAIKAGIVEAEVIVIDSELDADQQSAIQLAHNAITGKDDPNILKDIYESMALDWQKYSGVYEEMFRLDESTAVALGVRAVKYEELVIAFLPEDRIAFVEFAAALEKKKRRTALVGRACDFDAFFDAVVKVKHARNVENTATALAVMAEIVGEVLAAAEPEPPATPPA